MAKKVLIVSQPDDYTTSLVIQWLIFFRVSFVRLHQSEGLEYLKIRVGEQGENFELQTGDQVLDSAEIKGYWYRRGQINFSKNTILAKKNKDEIYAKLSLALSKELGVIKQYIHKRLYRVKSLNSYLDKSLNKIDVLYQAQRCGLKIPETLVTSSKKDVLNFIEQCGKLIVKPAFEAPFYIDKNMGSAVAYTTVLDNDVLDEMAENFFPSLFQKFIAKKFEVRAFFLDGAFYATAIFSQNNKYTKTDYRKNMLNAKNRNVPFKLPTSVENSIQSLMGKLGLNCGSIDLVVSTDGAFIFLEVNPIGQFSKISKLNNYYLEKKIAAFLAS